MPPMSLAFKVWNQLSNKPAGKWTFSKLMCLRIPYFSSISPQFEELKADYCQVKVKKHRAILNHIGTVHAIVMCNLAELAGGTMTDVAVPSTHRWIPKGMTVEYIKKAETDLIGIATPVKANFDWDKDHEFLVNIEVRNTANEKVFNAVITMWVSKKRA